MAFSHTLAIVLLQFLLFALSWSSSSGSSSNSSSRTTRARSGTRRSNDHVYPSMQTAPGNAFAAVDDVDEASSFAAGGAGSNDRVSRGGSGSWTSKTFHVFNAVRFGGGTSFEEEDRKKKAKDTDMARDKIRGIADPARERTEGKVIAEEGDKTGGGRLVCWHMRGRLSNPHTGATIASVEGVELTRSLGCFTYNSDNGNDDVIVRVNKRWPWMIRKEKSLESTTSKSSSSTLSSPTTTTGNIRGTAWARGLKINDVMKEKMIPSPPPALSAGISNKFFAFLDPKDCKPMLWWRPTSVSKRLPVDPYVAFTRVVSHVVDTAGRLVVCSEDPQGNAAYASTINESCVEENGDFFIGTGGLNDDGGEDNSKRNGWSPLALWKLAFSSGRTRSIRRIFTLDLYVKTQGQLQREKERKRRRRINQWIAFGPSDPPEFGCKESYTYVAGGGGGQDDEGAVFSYSRYGECPAWYGPGKMCSLDLQGRRLPSFAHLPEHLRALIAEVAPNFHNVPTTVKEFKSKGQENVQLVFDKWREKWWKIWKIP